MSIATFALILTGVLLNAAAQLLLKAGTNSVGPLDASKPFSTAWRLATELHMMGGFACYAVSLVVWVIALSRTAVSTAYPMLSIGYVVNAYAAWILFGEALTPTKIAGIVVIIAGVFLVSRA